MSRDQNKDRFKNLTDSFTFLKSPVLRSRNEKAHAMLRLLHQSNILLLVSVVRKYYPEVLGSLDLF